MSERINVMEVDRSELLQKLQGGGALPTAPKGLVDLQVEPIENFGELLSPWARDVYETLIPTPILSLPRKTGGWATVEARYLGKTLKVPLVDLQTKGMTTADYFRQPEVLEPLAKDIDRLIAQGYLGWGSLCKAMLVPLATIDDNARAMVLVYMFSELSLEEINERLGGKSHLKAIKADVLESNDDC